MFFHKKLNDRISRLKLTICQILLILLKRCIGYIGGAVFSNNKYSLHI